MTDEISRNLVTQMLKQNITRYLTSNLCDYKEELLQRLFCCCFFKMILQREEMQQNCTSNNTGPIPRSVSKKCDSIIAPKWQDEE